MIFWLLLIKTGTIPSKGCANPLEWAQVSQEALPELGWCILLWFSPKLLLCPWQSGRRSLWVWREQQPRRGIPPVDFLLSAPVLLGRPWQQTSKHLKISLSRKNNLPSTTEPPRRIRRAEGWIGDFLFFFFWPIINTVGAQWWDLCQCTQRKMSRMFPILKATLGHLLVFLLQRALGWVMKPVLLHKSKWLQTSQCSSQEQAAAVLFKRTLCFSMILKSSLTDDLFFPSPVIPLCPFYHWMNFSRYFLPLITEICIWFSFPSDLVRFWGVFL